MVAKFVLLAVLVASVSASGGYSSFSYGVSDPNTGDIKDQQEKRVGGNVVGKYSLLESDGTKRIVEYSADDATGFKAVVHKEPAGPLAAAAIGNPLGHPAHLAQAGAIANPTAHHASLAAISSLNHAAASPLSHGAISTGAHAAHAAAAHAAKVAHANKVAQAAHAAAAPLAHSGAISSISPLAHSTAFAAGIPLAHAAPVAPLAATALLPNRLYANHLTSNAANLAGHPSSLYGGYGNSLAGPLDYANRGAPTVSSYSHTIVHNGPDAFPNGGAYGRYGAYGNGGLGPHGTGLAGSALTHNNPWASGAALAPSNPWAPRGDLAHGYLTSPYAGAPGSSLGW